MAVPTIAAGGLSALASGTTQSPTIPTHAAGDILVVFAGNNGGQSITVGTAGWAALGTVVSDANFAAGAWWKRAAGAGETVTVTHGAAGSASVGHYAIACVVAGCRASGDPFDGVANVGTPTNSNRPQHGPVTSLTPDCLYVCAALVDDDNTWSAGTRTGFTSVSQLTSTTGGDWMHFIQSKALATPQTQGTEDFVNSPFTMSAADYWYSVGVAFASEPLPARPPLPHRPDLATLLHL